MPNAMNKDIWRHGKREREGGREGGREDVPLGLHAFVQVIKLVLDDNPVVDFQGVLDLGHLLIKQRKGERETGREGGIG